MAWVSTCSTSRCRRPATLIITGRKPGLTLYSALSCGNCAPKHRERAKKAGPVVETEHGLVEQPALF